MCCLTCKFPFNYLNLCQVQKGGKKIQFMSDLPLSSIASLEVSSVLQETISISGNLLSMLSVSAGNPVK